MLIRSSTAISRCPPVPRLGGNRIASGHLDLRRGGRTSPGRSADSPTKVTREATTAVREDEVERFKEFSTVCHLTISRPPSA